MATRSILDNVEPEWTKRNSVWEMMCDEEKKIVENYKKKLKREKKK